LVAGELPQPDKLHLFYFGLDSNGLQPVEERFAQSCRLRKTGEGGDDDLRFEPLRVTSRLKELPGEDRVIAIFLLEFLLPLWVPAGQLGVVGPHEERFTDALKNAIAQLLAINGTVDGFPDLGLHQGDGWVISRGVRPIVACQKESSLRAREPAIPYLHA